MKWELRSVQKILDDFFDDRWWSIWPLDGL